MKKLIPGPLYLPLAILMASALSMAAYLIVAEPQLTLKQARHAELSAELAARQQSLNLQKDQWLIDKLQQPLDSQRSIVKYLRQSMDDYRPKPDIRYSFGTPRPLQLDQLAVTALPLTLTVNKLPTADVQALIADFKQRLPNRLQLTAWNSEGSTNRLEFEIYGIRP